jgi:hypothetical protein
MSLLAPACLHAQATLSLVTAGTGINQTVTVTSSGQFKIVFEAYDNWGLSQWYDLVNDPSATTNLALAYSVNGASVPCFRENGIPQITFYGDNDEKASMFVAGCSYPTRPRSLTILTNTTSQVVIQTVNNPMNGIPDIDPNVTVTTTYDIRPTGLMLMHQNVGVGTAQNLDSDNLVLSVGLNDPSGGSSTTTNSGWIRATDTGNLGNPWSTYEFVYWDSSDPLNPNFTKASILLVPGATARALWASIGAETKHGWSCPPAGSCGTQRVGFRTSNADTAFNLPAGGSLSWDWLIAFGTQGSSVLSNFNSTTTAGPVATAYLAGQYNNSSNGQAPVISPTNPAVNQGQTDTFIAIANCGGSGGTWSVTGAGSIASTGACTATYTAPAVVNAQQSCGGLQCLPNNHIVNTRIDSLSPHASSASWIAAMSNASLYILTAIPINYVDATTPLESQTFGFTPLNNGLFQIPAFPDLNIECGYWSARQYNPLNCDHHQIEIDLNGTIQEMYNYYPPGTNPGCLSCTSASGQRYSANSYALPANGSTDAASMDLAPLMLRAQEVEVACSTAGTINHALRLTLNPAAEGNTFIWPATRHAATGGVVPYGARMRLKSSFNVSGFSACAQIILNGIKNYGLINADGGTTMQAIAEGTRWPKVYLDVLKEIQNANINKSNFEFVDESSLEISPTSGEANVNRETVCFTRTSDSAQTCTDVVLVGVTLNLPNDQINVEQGMPAQQLKALIGGTSNTNVTWTMSPTVGTLTSGGLYTPPATVTQPTVTTVTATSAANTNVIAQMTILVFPVDSHGAYRMVPSQSSNYVDSSGNTWFAGYNTGSLGYGGPGTEPCVSNDQGTPPAWPNTPDVMLYKKHSACFGDQYFIFTVPNGNYVLTLKTTDAKEDTAAGQTTQSFEVNGQVAFTAVDLFAATGGQNIPAPDYTLNTTVTNNRLEFVVRHDTGSFEWMSALQIQQVGSPPPPPPPPNGTGTVNLIIITTEDK